MYLDDFLILISDLHPNFQFFYQNKKNGVIDPISKVQIDGDRCILYTGENDKTIAQINHLLGKLKSNHLPIYVCTKNTNEKNKIFGIKINLVKGQVYIL